MSAKEVKFSVDARDRMLHGIDTLTHAVPRDAAPRAAMCYSTSLLGRPVSPRTA
jgi:hypothetical protein